MVTAPILLEVIVQTVADARAASDGGADRLEIVRDIRRGGLTPPLALVRAIRAETDLPVRVILRENEGFSTDSDELRRFRAVAGELTATGIDGVVLGFVRDGQPAIDLVSDVLAAAPGLPATFHRAFDELAAPLDAIDTIGTVPGIDRILTDGGAGPASTRCERLRSYVDRAGSRLVIVAGGGVDDEAFQLFCRTRCVREIHVGRIARNGVDPEAPVSADRVRRLRDLAG